MHSNPQGQKDNGAFSNAVLSLQISYSQFVATTAITGFLKLKAIYGLALLPGKCLDYTFYT